tara:strand:- start:394 stop:612 length:219 start_codon:yes stop_codon:yes gene_type:complete
MAHPFDRAFRILKDDFVNDITSNPNYSYTEDELKWAIDIIVGDGGETSRGVLKLLRESIQEDDSLGGPPNAQ